MSDNHPNPTKSDGMDREDWIDEDGDDCLPVFAVSKTASHYHKEQGGCTDPSEMWCGFDLFAAELDRFEPCSRCFADDPFVDVDGGTGEGSSTDTERSKERDAS